MSDVVRIVQAETETNATKKPLRIAMDVTEEKEEETKKKKLIKNMSMRP